MSTRNFEAWFATFRESINGYDYYVDFEKVYRNADKMKREIFTLNSLVNSQNVEAEFISLITEYPKCLKAVPILLAVRSYEIYCQDENASIIYSFNTPTQSPEQYIYFMRKTGLFDMLQGHLISNLYDYVMGVEVGLDSHSRKDRGGDQMEYLVESFLKKSGVTYLREIRTHALSRKLGISLPADFAHNKRWDFVASIPGHVCVIETNFYNVHGSKLNETARSYRLISEYARKIPGFTFIWITDGMGWKKAKNDLREAFNEMDNLYNITDMENGLFTRIFPR